MMTDLSGMIRWNANFVRGLAQSVLERAKVIRGTLVPSENPMAVQAKPARRTTGKKLNVKKSPKRAVAKKTAKPMARKSKKANG
jgi:hypothetical protein